MKFLTKDELQALLKVAKESSPADYLLVLLAFNHGLRVSEVLALTPKNFVDGHITVKRLKGSMRTTQRLSVGEAAAMDLFKGLGSDERLFPIHRQTAWRKIKTLGALAGIPAFKCFPHALKHTCAVTGLKGGMTLPEVQTRLGHKSGSSTMAYLRVSDEVADLAFAAAVGE
jgi:integrase